MFAQKHEIFDLHHDFLLQKDKKSRHFYCFTTLYFTTTTNISSTYSTVQYSTVQYSTVQYSIVYLALLDVRLVIVKLLVDVEAHEVLPRDHAHHPVNNTLLEKLTVA